ncbi:MAG: HNH endonuclease [Chloroflexi bacterium]|nr:HNH endonuclease [Chloroflexota bacterium]MBI5080829.1 HNH endonuclease [Chloroflexota bacterium]
MSQSYISLALRQRVAEIARYRCGYCLTSQITIGIPLHIEHIVPLVSGGETVFENLWLACPSCNGYKGIRTHAIDPETNQEVPLFNPRIQKWKEHFAWSNDGVEILGLTPVGRATVLALKLNNEYIVPSRRVWVAVKLHPPTD